jgi:mono/diheme cytochrome c family protein
MSVAALKNLVLAAILLVLVAAHWALPSDPTQRNFHYFPNMVDSLAHEAQAPVPDVAETFVIDLRAPEGSVARGNLPDLFEATPEDALRAGVELMSPIPGDDVDAVARGAFIFATFCSTCHGAAGMGDGPATSRGVPPPPSLFAERAMNMADGQMYHVVTHGQGNMASYASQVEREDRWKVVSYIRQMQGAAGTP